MKFPFWLKSPVSYFLVRIFALYIFWYFIYNLWLHPHTGLDLSLVKITIRFAQLLLESAGYNTFSWARTIGISGTQGLIVGDPCDGIALFATFTAFITAYSGPVLKKMVFIPLGILSIFLLNVLRVFALTIMENYSVELTEINHNYTFTIIIYAYIFFLWMLWVSKLGKDNKADDQQKHL